MKNLEENLKLLEIQKKEVIKRRHFIKHKKT